MRAEASRSGQYLKSSHRCKGELGWKDGDDWKEKGQQKQDHGLKQGGGEHLLVMKWEKQAGRGNKQWGWGLKAGRFSPQSMFNQSGPGSRTRQTFDVFFKASNRKSHG